MPSVIQAIFVPGSRCRCSCLLRSHTYPRDVVLLCRVSIVVSKVHKHTLPVNSDCAFSHIGGIGFGKGELDEKPKESVCTFADGTPVNNHDDLWRCMHEANCTINDDWLQMAVFRDPRPAVVSTYYHLEVHGGLGNESLDAFVAKELPILCQWVAARYILFSGMLVDQSFEFWYSAANANPLSWHYQWFFAVGLQLPVHVVESTAQAAAADDLGFNHKEIDLHPGEEARAETSVRRFEDEVSPDIVKVADAVLRTWLPPVLLERLGVEP